MRSIPIRSIGMQICLGSGGLGIDPRSFRLS